MRRSLRDSLRGDGPILATFLMIPRIEIVEMLGSAGFDAVVVDLEHGPHTPDDLVSLAAAAQGAGMYAIVRVREGTAPEIANVLDAGMDGVLVPHVSTAADAERIVKAGRFPPDGDRSLNPYVRGTRYALTPDVRDAANARVAILVMVEGAEGLENLEAIGEVAGVDAVFVGPVDLSAALGVPGQPEHPRVVETVRGIFARLAGLGVASSIFAPTVEAGRRWIEAGATLVALSADSAMIQQGFNEAGGAFRAQLRTVAAGGSD